MSKTDLFKQALADASEIQKVAIENAKIALSESFDSKLKEMLSAKMNEDADVEDEDELDESIDNEESVDEVKDKESEEEVEAPEESEEEVEEEFDIDAILAEMEAEEEGDEPVEESKDEESEEDSEEVEEAKEESPVEGEEEVEEEINLESLLKELMSEEESEEGEEEMDESKDEESDDESAKKIEELTNKLNEINLLNAKLLYLNKILTNNENLTESQKIKLINAFDEASNVKEVKLIHKTLNEAFKVKDVKTKNKKQLKESVQGLASAPAGNSNKMDKPAAGNEDIRSRWQMLAGIKK